VNPLKPPASCSPARHPPKSVRWSKAQVSCPSARAYTAGAAVISTRPSCLFCTESREWHTFESRYAGRE
jgi:hypothetical protein